MINISKRHASSKKDFFSRFQSFKNSNSSGQSDPNSASSVWASGVDANSKRSDFSDNKPPHDLREEEELRSARDYIEKQSDVNAHYADYFKVDSKSDRLNRSREFLKSYAGNDILRPLEKSSEELRDVYGRYEYYRENFMRQESNQRGRPIDENRMRKTELVDIRMVLRFADMIRERAAVLNQKTKRRSGVLPREEYNKVLQSHLQRVKEVEVKKRNVKEDIQKIKANILRQLKEYIDNENPIAHFYTDKLKQRVEELRDEVQLEKIEVLGSEITELMKESLRLQKLEDYKDPDRPKIDFAKIQGDKKEIEKLLNTFNAGDLSLIDIVNQSPENMKILELQTAINNHQQSVDKFADKLEREINKVLGDENGEFPKEEEEGEKAEEVAEEEAAEEAAEEEAVEEDIEAEEGEGEAEGEAEQPPLAPEDIDKIKSMFKTNNISYIKKAEKIYFEKLERSGQLEQQLSEQNRDLLESEKLVEEQKRKLIAEVFRRKSQGKQLETKAKSEIQEGSEEDEGLVDSEESMEEEYKHRRGHPNNIQASTFVRKNRPDPNSNRSKRGLPPIADGSDLQTAIFAKRVKPAQKAILSSLERLPHKERQTIEFRRYQDSGNMYPGDRLEIFYNNDSLEEQANNRNEWLANDPKPLAEKKYMEVRAKYEQDLYMLNSPRNLPLYCAYKSTAASMRLSLPAKVEMYADYIAGYSIRELSIKFGALPTRVKTIVWFMQEFFEDHLPRMTSNMLFRLIESELEEDNGQVVDYGVDLRELAMANKGYIEQRYLKRPLNHAPYYNPELGITQEEVERILGKEKRKERDYVIEKRVKPRKMAWLKNWLIYTGPQSIQADRQFQEYIQRSHYEGYFGPRKIRKFEESRKKMFTNREL